MYSGNYEDRFLFLCCQSVSILIFRPLGFYCRFLLVGFHFKVFFKLFLVLNFLIIIFLFWTETVCLEEFLQLIPSRWKTGNNLVFLLSHCQNCPRDFFFISLGFVFVIHIIRCEFHWTCFPPTLESHVGMCLGANPFNEQHQGYMFSILMPVLGNFILGFCSEDNYLTWPADWSDRATLTARKGQSGMLQVTWPF